MQFVEKGRLDLNTDVRTLVPEFPDKGTPITVQDYTVGDLSEYAAAIIHGKLLQKETWSLVSTVKATSDGKPTPLGLGFFVDGTGRQLRLAHDGSQEKSKTRMVIYPMQRSGVVVTSNSENVNPGEFTTAVFGALSQTK